MLMMQLPIQYNDLKEKLRKDCLSDVSNGGRELWWPQLIGIKRGATHHQQNDSIHETAARLLALASVRDEDIHKKISKDTVISILLKLNYNESLSTEIISSLYDTVIATVTNSAVCIKAINDLINDDENYCKATRCDHLVRLHIFKCLLQRYMPRTFAVMQSKGYLQDKYLNLMFIDLFQHLLPHHIILCMMDSFLLEGYRILYRYAIALIAINKKYIKTSTFESPDHFWNSLHVDRCSDRGVRYSVETIFSTAFKQSNGYSRSINISTKNLLHLRRTAEASNVVNTANQADCLRVYSFNDNRIGVDLAIHHSTDDNCITSASITNSSFHKEEKDDVADSNVELFREHSSILDDDTIKTLVSYLPTNFLTSDNMCVYNSSNDGWSMDCLYSLCKDVQPLVFLIRSLKSKAVLGAYLTEPITPPSNKVKGNGETFIFRLDKGKEHKYSWAGGSSSNNSSNNNNRSMKDGENITMKQFCIANSKFIMFGGSAEQCTNALYFYEDLCHVTSGCSDTFDNPPLIDASEYEPGQSTFEIDSFEVYCSSYSYNKRMQRDASYI